MFKRQMEWFALCGAVAGLTTLSIARGAVPHSSITDDTAIYQNLSEIRTSRDGHPNFDGDIARLSSLEPGYRERLPSLSRDPRLAGPMSRIASRAYRPSIRRKPVASR